MSLAGIGSPEIVADATRRQRQAAAPAATVWVNASAGTGKTKVLADRVLTLLLDGAEPQRILCLTYTRAAAAEMAGRINGELANWSTEDDDKLRNDLAILSGAEPDPSRMRKARQLFAEALDAPGGLKIMTIHAFCESLIGRFPLEAGVAPHFALMDERSSAEALRAAREEAIAAARRDENGPLACALRNVSAWVNEEQFADVLAQLSRERGKFARVLERSDGAEGLVARQRERLGLPVDATEATILADSCRDSAFDVAALRRACAALAEGSKSDITRGKQIADWLASTERIASFNDYCGAYLTEKGEIRARLATQGVDATFGEILRTEAERVLAVLERCKALAVADASASLVRFGAALLDIYERHKRERAALDYDDLVLAARRLLERDGGASWVLYKLDGGIDHILIDEAQDTSPDQWAVVRLLAEEFYAGEGARERVRTVFAVGDAKQSIFSFQGADPAEFDRMRVHFERRAQDAERKWQQVELDISFRSTDAVLKAVDAVFADEQVRHRASREGQAGLVEVWPAIAPDEAAEPEPWALPLAYREERAPDARLAEIIAIRIERLLGETLESRNRKIRPGDVMVLVSRRTGFIDALVRQLKVRRVPVAGIDRMVLTDQIAVEDLIALGNFLLLPDDDLTLAAVLKGPLFGLDDDQLFALAHGRGGSLWQELGRRERDDPAFARARAELAELLARVDFVPPFELYADLLGRRRGRERIVARLGRDARDPLDEFLALALAYQRSHAPSLQSFLHWLAAGRTEIKRDLEHGVRDEVRILTVHGAKGLQAPIVFLPDTMHTPRSGAPILWTDDDVPLWPPRRGTEDSVCRAARADAHARRDRERRRLLYVAMTRAEDRLYVCGWRGRNAPPEDCWYQSICGAMPGIAERISDLPVPGEGFRLVTRQRAAPETSLAEGMVLPEPARARPDWAIGAPTAELPPRPLQPSRPDGEDPPVRSPLTPDGRDAFRRGILIHRLLQALPDMAAAQRHDAALRYLERAGVDAPDAIVGEVLAILDDDRFAELFQPGARAEVALVGQIAGRLISGQVDRLLVTDDEVLVVDYKSNRPPPTTVDATPAIYLRQMAAYRAVLAEVYPERSIRCAILWTAAPALYELPDEMLITYAVDAPASET
jgi:ATP-dependent helicase/nuclease subunit A